MKLYARSIHLALLASVVLGMIAHAEPMQVYQVKDTQHQVHALRSPSLDGHLDRTQAPLKRQEPFRVWSQGSQISSDGTSALRTDSLELGWGQSFETHSFPSYDFLEDLIVDAAGNVFITGITDFEWMTRKLSPSGDVVWTAIYPRVGPMDTYGQVITLDEQGNVYVAGFQGSPFSDRDLVVLKYDALGVQQWMASYDGAAGNNDYPTSIKVDGDGNVVVAGYTFDETLTSDYLVIKYDPAGQELWNFTFNAIGYADDWIVDMMLSSTGEIYVAGIANQDVSSDDMVVIKLSAAGDQVYRTSYDAGLESIDWTSGMDLDSLGQVYVSGVSVSYDGLLDYLVFKLYADGSGAWVNRYSGEYLADAWATDVVVDDSLNVTITGVAYDDPSGFDFVTIQYDSLGAQRWLARYSSPIDGGYDQANRLRIDNQGRFLVTGLSESTDGTDDMVVVKYDTAGVEFWSLPYASVPPGPDVPFEMHVDAQDAVVVGAKHANALQYDNMEVIKIDSSGMLAWDYLYDGPGSSQDRAVAIASDEMGNAFVLGERFSPSSGLDMTVFKYDSLGNELWSQIWNGADSLDDQPADIVCDGDGNVIVVGSSEQQNGRTDMQTLKYAPDGTLLWAMQFDGPGGQNDEATVVMVDEDANIYVGGATRGTLSNADYTLIKYDPQGTELWYSRYVGPNYGSDHINAMDFDPDGNVVVTGGSYRMGMNIDYATVKYDVDGNEIWVSRLNGPVNLDDVAQAVKVDRLGNIYVTGTSMGSDLSLDILTVKYASSGQEIWTQRYDGSAGAADMAGDLMVDRQSAVYVAGTTTTLSQGTDMVLFKYDASGNLVWEVPFNGTQNADDACRALARDGEGSLYLLGQSDNLDGSLDMSIVKIDKEGNLQWVETQSGPGHSFDDAADITVDLQGTIWSTGTNHYFMQDDFDMSRILTYQYLQSDFPVSVVSVLPGTFALEQNYPNPFNPSTRISYNLAYDANVTLAIFDLRGREVRKWSTALQSAGSYSLDWRGQDQAGNLVPAGVYFCRFTADDFEQTIKMMLLK